jgi:hypothetical protein
MRKLILAMLFVPLLSQAANFKYDKTLVCGNREEIIESLVGEVYTESPLWVGRDNMDGSEYMMLINHHTGTWTILQMNKTIACVLGVGTEVRLNVGNLGEAT